jgi:hypothetical protein
MSLRSAAAVLLAAVALGLFAPPRAARAQCAAGQLPCGAMYCAPENRVCCAGAGHPELSCEAGTECKPDGTCVKPGPMCTGGGMATLATCGNDTCGCSAPCSKHADCSSGCCTTANFCAPRCVCDGTGQLFLNCEAKGLGFGGMPRSGCSVAPSAAATGAASGALLVVGLALAALALRRRVSR